MTLYEMTENAKRLYELLEADEIDEVTVRDTMEAMGTEEKLESYAIIQRQLESDDRCFASEIDRMRKKRESLERQIERLKRAQIEFMQATGERKAKAGTFSLFLRDTMSCEIIDESLIPAGFRVEIPASTRPDKRAMLDAMKNGAEISGAQLKKSTSLITK